MTYSLQFSSEMISKKNHEGAFEQMLDETAAVARSYGVSVDQDFLKSLVDRLMIRLGGSYVYFPRRANGARTRVRDEVVARFNGRNGRELAKELGVTVRYIQKIIADLNLQAGHSDSGFDKVR